MSYKGGLGSLSTTYPHPSVFHTLGINQSEIHIELSKALQSHPFLKQKESLRDSLVPPSNYLDFTLFQMKEMS